MAHKVMLVTCKKEQEQGKIELSDTLIEISGKVKTRAEKGWAMKRACPSKKV